MFEIIKWAIIVSVFLLIIAMLPFFNMAAKKKKNKKDCKCNNCKCHETIEKP